MNLKLKLFFLGTLIYGIKSQEIGDSINAFTIELLATTSSLTGSPPNLALSPYTVWTLLSIIDEGARGNTAAQLETVLRIPNAANKNNFRQLFNNFTTTLSSKEQGVNLDTYKSIFTTAEQKLNVTFRDVSEKSYNVNVQPIDFKDTKIASATINKYVAQATNNRITNFVGPDDLREAQIFIISTLYFKGQWTLPFKKDQTRRQPFYDEEQKQIGEVEMMYQTNSFPYSRIDAIKAEALELYYGTNEKMSMIVVLPYKGQTLDAMIEQMKKYQFSKIIDTLNKDKERYEGEDVKVYLPRFKVASDLTLNVVLQKMGISDVFNDQKADLLGIFPHYLYISKLIQRAEIDVNEEGTVASAVSGASFSNKIAPPTMEVNKPFLYLIVNKPTKTIMFSGKVSVPP